MELQKQVCSLELARKLKKLGVKKESFWSWVESPSVEELFTVARIDQESYRGNFFRAYSVAELGEMLPSYKIAYQIKDVQRKDEDEVKNQWVAIYLEDETHATFEYDDTEANARAKMLIYLIENKLIDL